jgi:4-hydroxy-3-methylbut-2-enyl diphosphate reductase IspH
MSDQTQQSTEGKSLIRVRPRGFCAGVVRAVDIVELALQAYGPPVYVHHEIVHNRYVVEQLRQNGAIFVETVAFRLRRAKRRGFASCA